MPFSQQEYDNRFGIGWHVKGNEIARALTFVTYPGTPSGNVVPEFVGQWLFNSVASDFYLATGLTNTDWKKANA